MKTRKTIIYLLLSLFFTGLKAQPNADPTTFYTVVDFINIKPGMEGEYLKLEDARKKLRKQAMDEGKLLNWAIYKAATNVGTAYAYQYAVVSIYGNNKQMAGHYGSKDVKNNASVLNKEELALLGKTAEIIEIVSEEVYMLLNQQAEKVIFPEVQWMQFLELNTGRTVAEFLKVEKQFSKTLDKAMMENGSLLNSQIYERKLPSGKSADFDLVRVLGFNDIEQLLESPQKYGAMVAKQNPGYAGLNPKFDIVSMYKEEMWTKVMCGCD